MTLIDRWRSSRAGRHLLRVRLRLWHKRHCGRCDHCRVVCNCLERIEKLTPRSGRG